MKFAQANAGKARDKAIANKRKEFNREIKAAKKAIRTRPQWYSLLETEVNKNVRLRDLGKPCCTCGTENPDIKYDAGHMISVGSSKELRFELTNIHRQCSVQCNQHGSGMRKEYELFIIKKYGQDHLDWLNGPHPLLKDRFPTHGDIEQEILRFRKLNREHHNMTKP